MLRKRFLEPAVSMTASNISELPSDMLRYISLFAETRTTRALSHACKKANDAITLNEDTLTNHNAVLTQAAQMAHLALRGRAIEFKKMLKEAEQRGTLEKLLREKIKVTSPCGRILTDVTVFQAIHWSLDTHMRTIVLEYIPEDIIIAQLHEHNSVNPPAYVLQHGRHVDFSAFNQAFEVMNAYIKMVNWSTTEAGDAAELTLQTLWQSVIREMRRLPKHVMEEVCRENRGLLVKGNLPKFDEIDAQHLTVADKTQLYPKDTDSEFGVTFGVVRADGAAIRISNTNIRNLLNEHELNGTNETIAFITAVAIKKLGDVRLIEYTDDTTQFLTSESISQLGLRS
jgi:hypothetical protein